MTSRNKARRHRGANRMVSRPPRNSNDLGAQYDTPIEDALAYWKKVDDDPLFVYFIQGENGGPVKIGRARNPLSRVRAGVGWWSCRARHRTIRLGYVTYHIAYEGIGRVAFPKHRMLFLEAK